MVFACRARSARYQNLVYVWAATAKACLCCEATLQNDAECEAASKKRKRKEGV
jgi:hypothetical protein